MYKRWSGLTYQYDNQILQPDNDDDPLWRHIMTWVVWWLSIARKTRWSNGSVGAASFEQHLNWLHSQLIKSPPPLLLHLSPLLLLLLLLSSRLWCMEGDPWNEAVPLASISAHPPYFLLGGHAPAQWALLIHLVACYVLFGWRQQYRQHDIVSRRHGAAGVLREGPA